jgi:hypothetical protein
MRIQKNPLIDRDNPLRVDIVFSPSWWHKNAGITFDRDFFFHPLYRVEAEQKMEQILYEKWGRFGLGQEKDTVKPEIGAVHLAAGFLLSEMLGCKVEYNEDEPPQVIPAFNDTLSFIEKEPFKTETFKAFSNLREELKKKFGYLSGDVNWGGVLNIALDIRGQELLMDFLQQPEELRKFFSELGDVIYAFVNEIESETGSSSISVNRNVRHFEKPIFLHSECSHTMISVEHYEQFLFPLDEAWSRRRRPFGIHYCGEDPHRYAESFAKLPHLDFLDVGWGGDLKILRENLPNTFLNIRLSPVEIIDQSPSEIENTITRLVRDSGDLNLTGVCCINMDDKVKDENITTIFETVAELRKGGTREEA